MRQEILGDGGDRLLNQFEPGPGGKPATVAYRCPGGRWTLGNGATEWPNGDQVRPGDLCTEEQAYELTDWSVKKFADVVDASITKPMTTNQRDAFILLAYNIGPHAFQHDCTASRLFNEGKSPLEVAGAFGKWCKATSSGPEKYDLDDPYYTPIIRLKAGVTTPRDQTDYVWVDADGNPCRYQRAFPGLLRRHLSEACLFLDLDWVQACRKDTVSLTSHREWDANENRWEDRVIPETKTELVDVLPVAKKYPLPDPTELVLFEKQAAAESPVASGSVSAALAVQQPKTPQANPTPIQSPAITNPAPAPVPPVVAGGGRTPVAGAPQQLPAPSVSSKPTGAAEAARPGGVDGPVAPATLPPLNPSGPTVVIPPKRPKGQPMQVDTSRLNTANMRTEAKPMEFSDRAMWFAVKLFGFWLKIMAGRGALPLTAVSYYFDFFNDPFLSAVVITGGTWLLGHCVERIGSWRLNFHRSTASTVIC